MGNNGLSAYIDSSFLTLIHAPCVGSDWQNTRMPWKAILFRSTLPVWGATSRLPVITQHTSRFQSTLPVGGATFQLDAICDADISISIHAPRVGSDQHSADHSPAKRISIHAPRGGSDRKPMHGFQPRMYFNPRSPWGERLVGYLLSSQNVKFQSTLPVGGATFDNAHYLPPRTDFNPRSPWGERHRQIVKIRTGRLFQSTLPVGGATNANAPTAGRAVFQSTLPVGGATTTLPKIENDGGISIHAPRVGSDHNTACLFRANRKFQSTLPVWGAT